MSSAAEILRGRDFYERRAWLDAYRCLSEIDRTRPLDPEDLWRLATAAVLLGHEDDFSTYLDRAHKQCLQAGNTPRAARCAFWIGFRLAGRGEMGQASGWFARARRLLEHQSPECAEHGYLLLPLVHQQMAAGEYDAALATAREAARLGEHFGEPDLHTLAVHLQGQALLEQSRVDDGLALLDESMIAVATGELSPVVTGLIYCSMIGACRRIYALGRAHEWTAALRHWCEQQPDMVTYTGQCLVYRAELMQLQGEWPAAIQEARRAFERCTGASDQKTAGSALYQEAEVHRLLGEFSAAEESYRNANRSGRQPQPGLALLRLAQGDAAAAAAAIRRSLSETSGRLQRARLLPAYAEIALAVGELEEARQACEELEQTAAEYGASVLRTIAAHARGAVDLAAGDANAALVCLREALEGWQRLDAPYEAARARVLLGLACGSLGDEDAAELELEAAREVFARLGAAPDLSRIDALRPRKAGADPRRLTPRELEVLALLATGRTNREMAAELFISEKTVARHVSNIFTRLGVPNRAAATAYAYEHDLL